MELVLKRDQDKGMLGGIKFTLEARAILTSEEQELVKKYKADKYVLFDSKEQSHLGGFINIGPISYTINDLMAGTKDKVKDVSLLLQKEEVLIEACKNLKNALDVMKSFGGEYRVIFKEDGVYDSNGNKIG
jgi:hypothetical protein